VAGAGWISDGAFTAAAEALAAALTDEERASGLLFPAISRLREVTREVAVAVARQAANDEHGADAPELAGRVAAAMWSPDYPELIPV